ncbi:MAG: hypothetical protein LBH21_00925 [Gracilibacteraceae bacterium]|jgi:hypothetical protein|nr:hypothetical protein [Gracilibacteraceae bacterium]
MANNMRKFKFTGNIPSEEELDNLWENIKLEKSNAWTQAADTLKNEINKMYSNGGVKLSKYKITQENPLNYFIINDRRFVENIYKNNAVLESRPYLGLNNEPPVIKVIEYFTDIYSLSGNLARILGYGGAYTKGIEQRAAWKTAAEFVENEFEIRFEEFNYYIVEIENAKWFYDVAWDYSFIIADTTKNEIVFIDITDTD